MTNTTLFQRTRFISRDLLHIWFSNFSVNFEKNSQNTFSKLLIKFRNLSIIAHIIRLCFCFVAILYFSLFRFHKELLGAYCIELGLFFEGFYGTLVINYYMIQIHRYAIVSIFLFKIIMVWVDLLSILILSIIFSWEIQILEFLFLQFVFILFDTIPTFSIFLLFQNEISSCKRESQHLITGMVKIYIFMMNLNKTFIFLV